MLHGKELSIRREQEETEKRMLMSGVPESEEVVNAAGFRGLLI